MPIGNTVERGDGGGGQSGENGTHGGSDEKGNGRTFGDTRDGGVQTDKNFFKEPYDPIKDALEQLGYRESFSHFHLMDPEDLKLDLDSKGGGRVLQEPSISLRCMTYRLVAGRVGQVVAYRVGAALGFLAGFYVTKSPAVAEVVAEITGNVASMEGAEFGWNMAASLCGTEKVSNRSRIRQEKSQHKDSRSLLQRDDKGRYLFK